MFERYWVIEIILSYLVYYYYDTFENFSMRGDSDMNTQLRGLLHKRTVEYCKFSRYVCEYSIINIIGNEVHMNSVDENIFSI